MRRLAASANGRAGRAFYVLPNVGSQRELYDVGTADALWLLDVADVARAAGERGVQHPVRLAPPRALVDGNIIEAGLRDLELDPDAGLGLPIAAFALPTGGEIPRWPFGFAGRWAALALAPDR